MCVCVFILKAHEFEWAFGFGQGQNTRPESRKQENSPDVRVSPPVTICHHLFHWVVTDIFPVKAISSPMSPPVTT